MGGGNGVYDCNEACYWHVKDQYCPKQKNEKGYSGYVLYLRTMNSLI